ncbi:small ribosomal subunit Rsm22 family protein [Microbispora sp. H11081]|uniref:small ribosomal subunit Rsm22 family protein n=1 Tax=Microbispora sp. H11081 TaxID=2729107 RepID=UPI001B8C0807|nr:small ribosomal subunit Rsm22 family protein [Microbispora sp. H11081]
MSILPDDLEDALEESLARFPAAELTRSVRTLIRQYREGFDRSVPALGSEAAVAAYAGYRMPATYSAMSAALRQVALLAPGFAPETQVDVGGGTGSALWAASAVWPALRGATVIEQSSSAIAFGRRLAARAPAAAVREARWQQAVVDRSVPAPTADLVTMSYVLGELSPAVQEDVVESLASATERNAGMLVIVEPGTPAGYARIAAARRLLTGLGLHLVAPCPHVGECPISAEQRDWCHFAVRLNRTALHRRIKDGTLSFEDEKFSFVAASARPWPRAESRVLRHPLKRKGLVTLRLCTAEDGLADRAVSKRQGETYREARDAVWGDAWPPVAR